MLEYRAEGLCRNASHLRREELDHCIAAGEVLQSTALEMCIRDRVEALGHAALADGSCQHALAAIDQVDFIPCVQCHAGHKGLVASLLEQLLAISGGFALGFGLSLIHI